MSILLFCTLLGIICTELVIMVVFNQNSSERIKQLQYSYGFELKKAENKIESLKSGILSYHDNINATQLEIDDMERKQKS